MPLAILAVPQMRQWEAATWASGQTEEKVMRLAGRAIADKAAQLSRPGDLVLVLAGKGHNGDDARFAAESPSLEDRQVRLLRVLDPEIGLTEIIPLLQRQPALIIDGLFGIGLDRPVAASWLNLIREINQANSPILAVDVPSGVNAESGEPMDEAIKADFTLTLGAVKVGLLSSNAAPFVGRLEVAADIGLIPCPFLTELNWITAADFAQFPPRRPVTGHKGTFGHLAVVAGSLGYHGASVLAARGAQRAQPGLITLFTAENVYHPVSGQLQSVMVRPWAGEIQLPDTCTAVAIGPGLASADVPGFVRQFAQRCWQQSGLPVVADASALEWLPPGPYPPNALRVVTPHPGEAARLLQSTAAQVQSNRVEALRKLSGRYGDCWVVLKGNHTLSGRTGETVVVNSSGNPCLAQGGSGDLLTGYLGGLLAQPHLQSDPGKTIRFAVWQHGASADILSDKFPNWTIEDLAAVLGSVRRYGVRTL